MLEGSGWTEMRATLKSNISLTFCCVFFFFCQITELSFIASFSLNQCVLKYTLKTSDFLRSGSVEYQKWRIQRSSICTKYLQALFLIPLWRLVGVSSELMPNLIQKFSQWTLNPNSLCVSLWHISWDIFILYLCVPSMGSAFYSQVRTLACT